MIKKRYSDEDLEEFRIIIEAKLALARTNYKLMLRTLRNEDGNDVADTSPTFKVLEDGSATQSKEDTMRFAMREEKFIRALEAALLRIENTTYGIDRISGELIPKERLRIVPHATLSVESKNANRKH